MSLPLRFTNGRLLPESVPHATSRIRCGVYSGWLDPLSDRHLSDQMFYILSGIRKAHFRHFYDTYCGVGTPIDKHSKLFMLLRWYKQYFRGRELSVALGVRRNGTRLVADIKRWSAWLANRVSDAELLANWHARFDARNRLPVPDVLFGGQVTGALDTFPIYLYKPKNSNWQRLTYSGKYHANVLKVQMIVDNTGTPIWLSGPHIGTYADIRLARQHMPAGLQPTERFLADKAYCSSDMPHLSAPYKKERKPRRRPGDRGSATVPKLTRQQLAFNIVSGFTAHRLHGTCPRFGNVQHGFIVHCFPVTSVACRYTGGIVQRSSTRTGTSNASVSWASATAVK